MTDEKVTEKAKTTKKKKQRSLKEPKVENKKNLNKWKVAFLILAGLVLGSLLFFTIRVTQIREPNLTKTETIAEKDGTPVLSVQSNKKQVNALIDFYLEDFQKGSDIKYQFYLENEALLNGTFDVLGHPIQFYLYFEPYVMDNGNVQLKAKSLSLGTLGLPIKEVLKFVQRDYKLPKWVEVAPDEKTILLRLDQFQMQNGLFLRAEKINLVDDEISMNIYLPKETIKESQTTESSSE
ncbi:YpmS family protein [Enterococcus sp. LJL99]